MGKYLLKKVCVFEMAGAACQMERSVGVGPCPSVIVMELCKFVKDMSMDFSVYQLSLDEDEKWRNFFCFSL